ncbi:hypothetical protein BJ138DRAFT_1197066, partial [Hygrophoropsis aurantiaca]
ESKHIKAVKEPWRRSSRYEALSQMLRTNQRLDKLAASRVDFQSRGMLNHEPNEQSTAENAAAGTQDRSNEEDQAKDDVEIIEDRFMNAQVNLAKTPQRKRAKTVPDLAKEIHQLDLHNHIRRFLYGQIHPDDPRDLSDVPLPDCPCYEGRVSVFHSAAAIFYAPSDPSGIGGMKCEHIRATPSWRKGHPRFDCVFVNKDPTLPGMRGLDIARILCFFSFSFHDILYPCALVRWFTRLGNDPDEDTGMWIVEPQNLDEDTPDISVIHIDCIFRAAHLIPIYGDKYLPKSIKYHHSYDVF